jgi:hypothetical protein
MRTARLIVGCTLLAAGTAVAQAPTGPEFRVNTITASGQGQPSVAADSSGNFVVVWTIQPSSAVEVNGQRFDVNGVPRGAEFRVNVTDANLTSPARVASDAAGGFMVVWEGLGPQPYDVFARRYGANGLPLSGEVLVNTHTTGLQVFPSVASGPAGTTVVTWASDHDGDDFGVFGRRFDASGAPVGGEFQVNSYTTGHQFQNAVAMDGSGNFVVVWEGRQQDGTSGIFGQRFAAGGTRLGGEFQLNTPSPGMHERPSVAAAGNGDFVVAWSYRDGGYRILARRFAASGAPRGAEFGVNPGGIVDEPEVAIGPSGAFWVVWEEFGTASWDVKGRRFDQVGNPQGHAFPLTASTTNLQGPPTVAVDGLGNNVATWASNHDLQPAVYAQRFGLLEAVALAADTTAGASSDGNHVLEPGETADLRMQWRNNSAAPRTLSGTITQLVGPAGATYSVVDGSASYGSVGPGGTAACLDCYAVFVSDPAPRPVLHWDAVATEVINPGDDAHASWPIHLGDSFTDVARASGFYPFIETLLHHSVTGGCGTDTYCPASSTTREQMAPFVLVAREGAGYLPRACGAPLFADVPAASAFCRWIEELARRGVVGGCSPGLYCPTEAVTREQMAVFVLRTLDPELSPPACGTPVFNDVPASSVFCRWIEELARRGVVTGCGGGSYCPSAAVTREQMSVFLSGTFGLTLYGP